MNILVTGSSGTIGTRLMEKLTEAGHRAYGLDCLHNKWQPSVDALTAHADLRSDQQTFNLELPADIDAIVHLAANARVYDLVEDPSRARDNLITTFNALELARRRGIKKFVFASSRETYGNTDAQILREDMARIEHCESPYTASKIGGEALVESYKRCYKLDTIIFRFSNVYGMYDDSDRIVPLFFRKARKNETLTVFGKDKCLDFTYIDDCVAGIMLGLEKFDTARGGTYNLAYGQGTTLVHVAERMKELLNSSSDVVIGASRIGEVIRYVADISKAKKVLGYEPKVPFEEGVKKSVEWYAENT